MLENSIMSPFVKSVDYMEEDEKEMEKEVGTLKIPSRLIFLFNYWILIILNELMNKFISFNSGRCNYRSVCERYYCWKFKTERNNEN